MNLSRTISSNLKSFFSHPAVGAIGILSGVIGLFLGVYFYNKSILYRNLVYYVHPIKSEIVQNIAPADLKIIYKGKAIVGNLTIVQVMIWNDGNLPIRPAHFLKPLKIYTKPQQAILEATIGKSTRPDIVGVTISPNEYHNGKVPIAWKILEQDDGFVIQLLVTGSSKVDVGVEGAVEGQRSLSILRFRGRIENPSEQYTHELSRERPNLFNIVIVVVTTFFWLFLAGLTLKAKTWWAIAPLAMAMVNVKLFWPLISYTFDLSPYPPFDF